ESRSELAFGVPLPSLQRGRARAGAESRGCAVVSGCFIRASTGPRPRGRGIHCLILRERQTLVCFNGAAPARARNPNAFESDEAKIEELQRGRARAGAESTRQSPTADTVKLLQRGRARAGAESPGAPARLSLSI